MEKEQVEDHVLQMRGPSLNRRASPISSEKMNSDDVGSQSIIQPNTNYLVMLNDETGALRMPDLMKASAEVLGSRTLGPSYKVTMANGSSFVVKRMRHMNKLNKDEFEVEVRKLGRIRHKNVLHLLGYHYRKEEKMFVTEYYPTGSLSILLHGGGDNQQSKMNWQTRLKIIKGIAQGMGFLHTEFANSNLPNGNLKSSNIVLSTNYEPLLTDYAFYPLMNSDLSTQPLFAFKSPEAEINQATVSPKSDVYCLGIVIFEIMTRKLPVEYPDSQNGGIDIVKWVNQAISEGRVSEVIDQELANESRSSIKEMEKVVQIGANCTESDPGKRIEMREAIRSIEEVQI